MAEFIPIVPDHELIQRIGAGSYGEVWLARNVVGTYRAVKVVYRKTFEHDRPYEREFGGMQKFEPVSRTHAGLVNVLQIGRNDQAGYFYYLMELADDAGADRSVREHPPSSRLGDLPSKPSHELDGSSPLVEQDRSELARTSAAPINPATYKPKTLGEVGRHGRLSREESVHIVLRVTSSLAHLHRHGLVHRDIKPSNILIINGAPKLADIGLVAGINDPRSFVGTEGFIAPEGPGKPQADLYSLGKVLYEISTGKDRHDFPDLPADLRDSADQAGFSELNEVILKACASDVAQRYSSAEEMQADLLILQKGKSVKQKRVKERRRALAKRVGFSAVVLATVVGVFLPLHRQWKAQRPMAPKALDFYTDSQAYLRKGTKKDMEAAIPLLEQALALDQNHPKIHAALAWAYEKNFFFFSPTNRELEVKAGHALDRARQLGPKLPETHFANAYMLWYRPDGKGFQHEQAIASYRRVFEADPDLAQENPMLAAETRQQLAGVYLHIGLMDEASEEATKALAIDSVHGRRHFYRGFIALFSGDYPQAEAEFRRGDVLEAGEHYSHLALACLKQGKANEARNVIEKALKDSPTDPGGQFASVEAMLFARVGEFTRAEEAIQKAEQRGKGYGHFHHTAFNIGCVYALMNQPEDAVRWLRTAADTGFPCYPAFKNDPDLAKILSDAPFQKFLDEQKDLWMGRKEFQGQLDAKSRERPIKPEALELYTDGQVYLRKGTSKDMDVAIPLLEQALALEQNHPKIHAALACAYEKKFFFYAPTNRELDVKAGQALDRARQLGPELSETHFAQGYLLWYRPDGKGWQHEPAIASFRRVLEANPHLAQENPMLAAETHQKLAGVYLHMGLMDESLEEAKKALEIDSVQSRFHYSRGLIAQHRGDYQQAEEELRRGDIMDVGRNYAELALACLKQDKAKEAKNVIENGLKDSPTDPGGQFASVEAMLFARVGEFTQAKEAIQKAEQRGKGFGHFHHTAYNIGCAYGLMNQPEDAVRWLRTAADTGFPCYPAFHNDPTLANIRSDSEFQRFLDEQRNLLMGHKEFQRQLVAKSRM